ncbi:MAG: metal ABC transporter ATP-binding protein [Betaproteobacteria bacterium]
MTGDSGTAPPVLDVLGLTVRFGHTVVFSQLAFRVERGAAVAVVGPNGAGKTVLFRTLIGALPYEGSIAWAPDVRIGYVPQKLDIARDVPITGAEFLRAGAALARAEEAAVSRALAAVGLREEVARQTFGAFSGGQFQRLLLAFALVGSPNVLLLDEPTANVDEPGQEQLNELVHRLQAGSGMTVLLISHDLSIVFRYASHVLCLGRDRSSFGPPRAILTEDLLRELYGSAVKVHDHVR